MNDAFIVGSVFIGAIASVVVSTFLLFRESSRRSEIRKIKAELSFEREYIDRQLDEINQVYSNNYNLWIEANRLPVEAQPSRDEHNSSSENFLSRIGIDVSKIELKKNQVLILMPIDKKYVSIFRSLQDACKKNLYSPVRSDQDFVQIHLLGRIVQLILESELVICDISTRNPNVLYELGIAHAMNKNTIIISQQNELEQSPFDVRSNRILLYKDHYDLEVKLSAALNETKYKTISRLGPVRKS